jgi:hypothetical protein
MRLSARELCTKFAEHPFSAGKGDSAVSFGNGKLYSYHACIAEIVSANHDGNMTARVTTKRYSVTTSRHTTFVSSALMRAGYSIISEEF